MDAKWKLTNLWVTESKLDSKKKWDIALKTDFRKANSACPMRKQVVGPDGLARLMHPSHSEFL